MSTAGNRASYLGHKPPQKKEWISLLPCDNYASLTPLSQSVASGFREGLKLQ